MLKNRETFLLRKFVKIDVKITPENTLKFGVGVMLSAFGVFWTGEGLGVRWPGADLALLPLAALFLLAGIGLAHLARALAAGRPA